MTFRGTLPATGSIWRRFSFGDPPRAGSLFCLGDSARTGSLVAGAVAGGPIEMTRFGAKACAEAAALK